MPPVPGDAEDFKACFAAALSATTRAVPELAEEIRAIVSEVIVIAGAPGAPYQFDGGSSYRLWGALFLNVKRGATRVGLIEALAHEAAHSLLFGLSVEETLARNPDDELFTSPLRADPRPMDGIYHAAFVSARMHWAMSGLIASDLLTDEERAWAAKARDEDRVNFEMGYDTIATRARLTDTGRMVLDATRAYMRGAA
ncbi:MAG: aKG-HExxH-type peptide beta-hydroxylase [Dongiaceae bacterium]